MERRIPDAAGAKEKRMDETIDPAAEYGKCAVQAYERAQKLEAQRPGCWEARSAQTMGDRYYEAARQARERGL